MTDPLVTSLATVADFVTWPGVLVGDDETASAQIILDAASDEIRIESGDPDRWADPTTAPASIKRLTVRVAARAWANPTMASMLVTGPFTEQFNAAVADAVYLTDADKNAVGGALKRPKLWTLSTTRDGPHFVNGVPDYFSGERIPSSPYPDGLPSWGQL